MTDKINSEIHTVVKQVSDALQTAADKYGPETIQTFTEAVAVLALTDIVFGIIGIIIGICCLTISYYCLKFAWSLPKDKFNLTSDREIVLTLASVFFGIVGGLTVLISGYNVAKPINYIGLYKPQVYIAYNIINRLNK